MIVVPKEGRVYLADQLWRPVEDPPNQNIVLLGAAVTEGLDAVYADVTECVFTGYAPYNFGRAANDPAVLDGTQAQTLLTGGMREWEVEGDPQPIYGWALTDSENEKLLLFENYDTPHETIIGSIHRLYPYVNLGKLVAD